MSSEQNIIWDELAIQPHTEDEWERVISKLRLLGYQWGSDDDMPRPIKQHNADDYRQIFVHGESCGDLSGKLLHGYWPTRAQADIPIIDAHNFLRYTEMILDMHKP